MAKWMKKNWINFFVGIALCGGLCLLLYPTVSDWWNRLHQSRAIASYAQAAEGMSAEEIEAYLALAREYNKRLLEKESRFKMTEEEQKEYAALLDITGTGIMGYIEIPAIHVSLPVYHGTDEATLQIASGHIAGSSLPVGGENTHAAVSGHTGLPSARLFTDLDKLSEGDTFTITVLNQSLTYEVDQIRTVLPEDTSELVFVEGADYCTLQTCTPYGINTHRLLVRGKRIETP